jgi:hypothetical protein
MPALSYSCIVIYHTMQLQIRSSSSTALSPIDPLTYYASS